jgi:predicted  nucleic acid-binding Zn-ribbon protein
MFKARNIWYPLYNLTVTSLVMYLQTMRGLKRKINQLSAELDIGKGSTTKRFKKAEQRCEEAGRELSDMDRSSEDIEQQMLCPQESVDALSVQTEVAAETSPSASTERMTALDSQLSKTQVNWKLRIGLMYL